MNDRNEGPFPAPSQDFQISMFDWPHKIAFVEDKRGPSNSPLRVGETLTMTDVHVTDVRPDGTPSTKEDYCGTWLVEGISYGGRFALVKRPDAASMREREKRLAKGAPPSLFDDFSELIIKVNAQVADSQISGIDEEETNIEIGNRIAAWVLTHGNEIARALRRDTEIENPGPASANLSLGAYSTIEEFYAAFREAVQ
jgi:hypothetical protein